MRGYSGSPAWAKDAVMRDASRVVTERDLIAAGFQLHGNGSLVTPGRIRLVPAGTDFFRLIVELPNGEAMTCHVSRRALKLVREKEAQA
jgi:hypothetical protein